MMKARIARFALSSMLSTGILGGFLVEPNYPLLRQFTQPAHADQCDGGENVFGVGGQVRGAGVEADDGVVVYVGLAGEVLGGEGVPASTEERSPNSREFWQNWERRWRNYRWAVEQLRRVVLPGQIGPFSEPQLKEKRYEGECNRSGTDYS
jgi:hypothetical protein